MIAALFSGARYSELARLVVGDFDPRSETLLIRMSKSGKSRKIPLTIEAVQFFRRLTTSHSAHELMLTRTDGSPWGEDAQIRPMRDTCKRAGIDSIGFHGLRHSFASNAVQDGVPLLVVAHSLGHCDTKMCEKHYAHLSPDHARAMIQDRMKPFGLEGDSSNIVTLRR